MRSVKLEYFVNKEKEGVVFAKITKAQKSDNVHGTYFPYEQYIGQVLDSSVNSDFIQSTIEPLDVAFGYFHYGNQITIVNFTKLAEVKSPSDFSATENIKRGCFDVNALWVEAVLSLNEKRTFDFLFSHIHEETIEDMSRLAIEHLKAGNCDVEAHCLEEYIRNKKDTETQSVKGFQAENQKGFIKKLVSRFTKRKYK